MFAMPRHCIWRSRGARRVPHRHGCGKLSTATRLADCRLTWAPIEKAGPQDAARRDSVNLQFNDGENPAWGAQLTPNTSPLWISTVLLETQKGVRAFALTTIDEQGAGSWA